MTRNWRFLLQVAISAALVLLLVRALDWARLAELLARTDHGLALAASLLVPVVIGLLALRLRLLVRAQGIPLTVGRAIGLTWAGQFFNSVLPGSTGGDVLKIYELCRLAPTQKTAAAVSILVDRLSALLALLVLAAAGLGVALQQGVRLPPEFAGWGADRWWLWLLAALLGGAALVLLLRHPALRRRFLQLRGALRAALAPSTTLLAVGALAFAIHGLSIAGFWLFARALGLSLSYPQALAIVPAVMFLLLLPVTVNGHGLREVLLIAFFGALGITIGAGASAATTDVVLALSALLVANDLLWCLPGGVAYLLLRRGEPPASG